MAQKPIYKYIYLPNGDYLQIKFDEEGIVYDRFNEDDEHKESYGYDFYEDVNLSRSPTIGKYYN